MGCYSATMRAQLWSLPTCPLCSSRQEVTSLPQRVQQRDLSMGSHPTGQCSSCSLKLKVDPTPSSLVWQRPALSRENRRPSRHR